MTRIWRAICRSRIWCRISRRRLRRSRAYLSGPKCVPKLEPAKASLLVALAFAFLHLPTYLRAPISGQSAVRDLSVLVIVLPFAIAFRILIAYAHNRTAHAVLIAAITHASFNEASELIAPNVPGGLGQVLAFASSGLLAVLAVVVSKGVLAYHRASRKTKSESMRGLNERPTSSSLRR